MAELNKQIRPEEVATINHRKLGIDLYEEMPALCLMVDTALYIRKINRFGCEQLGYQFAELINHEVGILAVPSDLAFFTEKLEECIATQDETLKRFEIMQRRKDGSQYWVRITIRGMRFDTDDPIILMVSEDITETRYLIHELEQQNSVDSLTGLCNRRRFDRELEQVVVGAKMKPMQHALCFIDLDQFKVVNDSAGHQAGDELLRNISRLLQKTVRSNDILARLGGDEFGLILKSCSLSEAELICEKIITSLSKNRFYWDDEVFTVGASIGILPIDATSGSATELLRQADSACYVAKDRGRNCIHLYSPNDIETERRGQLMRWLSRLHWAFENDSFELYIQCILPIQAQHKQAKNYEMLVRMRDEDNNLIMPGAFIPAAEYYGLASKMDMWVTKKAIDLATQVEQKKSEENVKKTYFINLSGLTLGDKKFVSEISKLLTARGKLSFDICFEITETATIQNMSAAIEFMQHFRALGCMFALDDFGSGFSSFSYLKALPVDFIKIDGAFVRTITSGPTEVAIVKAIHEVARAFGMQTIAEHIETPEILEKLVALGIDFAQGYHLHKPSPFDSEQNL